jgi:uncharacterized membrane protein YqjE
VSDAEPMQKPTSSSSAPAMPVRIARHLLAFGGNRVELFMLELEEEQRHFSRIVFLGLATSVLALLAGIGFTAALVMLLWPVSPAAVLLGLGACYAVAAVLLYRRIQSLQRDWKIFPATVEQLQKDGECLEEMLN